MRTKYAFALTLTVVLICGCRTTTVQHREEFDYPKDVNTIYFILGALNEYIARRIRELGDSTVERFYGSERKDAEVFNVYMTRLTAEEKINTSMSIQVGPGGHIYFVSPELRHRINSMYEYKFERSWGRLGVIDESRNMTIRETMAYVSPDVFQNSGDQARLSYLAGAYMRYGEDDSFHFANADHKVDLIVDLLKQFGCRRVELKVSAPDIIPRGSTITFDPSGTLRHIFAAVDSEKEEINKNPKIHDQE
jgi:hypothetical protein